jgi:VCPO second helical-bundle domain
MLNAGKLSAVIVSTAITLQANAPRVSAQTPNVVIQWNQALQAQFVGTGPGIHIRALPMMHIAMFDAINSIEELYTPYLGQVKGSHGASAEAAAAAAARDVLASLYPTQQAVFDDLLASQLAGMPPGLARQGVAVGQASAKAVLEWRKNDGWPATQAAAIAPDPTYVLPPFPGLWQPTPPANSFATFTFYPHVLPFAMLTATQFLPPPTPTLISTRYAIDFNEVKTLGSVNSAVRTAEQTLWAQVHAGVNTQIGFFHVWNRVAADVAQRHGLSLIDTARTFVLLTVGLHDGLQTSFTSKFTYGLWRPVTAIRRASEDLNPATVQEDNWTPLLTTPTYPSYAGNAACLSAASARALQIAFGEDDIPITVTYPRTTGLATVTRTYAGFSDLAQQEADSRIFGGIHFRFDSEASQAYCVKAPEFAAEQFMLPRDR